MEQCLALEVNYFDDTISPTSMDFTSEAAEQINKSSENNLSSAKQEVESVVNIPESQKTDTSYTSQQPLQLCTDTNEKPQQCLSAEHVEQDADIHQEDEGYSSKNVA